MALCSDITILIPAAGASTRMRGQDKLLMDVDGQPMIAHQTRVALATGKPVFVTLPTGHSKRASALENLKCASLQVLPVQKASEGIAASLRTGVAAAGDASALLIVLADMPALTTADLNILITAHQASPSTIFRAASPTGKPGHPTVIPSRLFNAVSTLSGDEGAKSLLRRQNVTLVPLADDRATLDLDTPEDWDSWHQGKN